MSGAAPTPTRKQRHARKARIRLHVRAVAGWACIASLALALVAGAAERTGIVFQSDRHPDPVTAAAQRLLAVTDIGNLRLVISNAGTLGTSFLARDTPSMEWPARSGVDHLVRGALWVGAINAATGDTLVTSGGRDAYYLDPIFQYSEFTPVTGRPQEFSRLRTSPYYRRGTVSDENIHTVFVDTIPVVKQGAEERHKSMGIRVVQNSYTWGFDPVDDFAIQEYNIINVGTTDLQNVWIGIYTEMATNNRQAFANWPPGGSWFDFQDPEYDDSRHLLVNRHYFGGNGRATQYAALKLVGSGGRGSGGRGPDSLSTKRITLTAWTWSPNQFLTWNDDSLYVAMSSGTTTNFAEFDPLNTELNPSSIFALGPFPLLAAGDTVQVVFGLLAGDDLNDLRTNAGWVQEAYDRKYALPSPPSSPIVRLYPEHRGVTLRWSAHPEFELDPASMQADFQGYRVYLSNSSLADSFRIVRDADVRDGVGLDTGLEGVLRATPYYDGPDTLQYELRLDGLPDGSKRYAAVTSYDAQPVAPRTLESGVLQNSVYFVAGPSAAQAVHQRVSVFPNPYRGESSFDGRDAEGKLNPRRRVMWFVNLPPRAHLEIFTLAGDRVRTYDFDAASYRGTEAAGIRPDNADLAQGRYLTTGGSMLAFDLLSDNGQEIATGLYLFAVENKDTGDKQQGKFLVLK